MKKLLIILAICLLIPERADAYVGPGLGGGIVTVIIGVITAFFLSIFAIFWYPLKRLFKKLKSTFVKEKQD